jgi:ribosomal protein L37AE/L43A
MPECPCCSEKLLRHFRQGKVYWFCTHCWQEMPDFTPNSKEIQIKLVSLSDSLEEVLHV